MRSYSSAVRALRLALTWWSRKSVAAALNVRTSRAAFRSAIGSLPPSTAPRTIFACPAGFFWRQSPMLADAGPARAAVLPILGDVAFAAIAEGGDAEAANGLPVTAVPEDFPVFVRRADKRVNTGLCD